VLGSRWVGRKNVRHVHVAVITDLNMLSVGAHGEVKFAGHVLASSSSSSSPLHFLAHLLS